MKDRTNKATAIERAQVEKDYGPMKRIGEGEGGGAVVEHAGRGWDGNKGSAERTDKVPDTVLRTAKDG